MPLIRPHTAARLSLVLLLLVAAVFMGVSPLAEQVSAQAPETNPALLPDSLQTPFTGVVSTPLPTVIDLNTDPITPTLTTTVTATLTVTPTVTITPTMTITPTVTVTPTITPEPTITPTMGLAYLPAIYRQPAPVPAIKTLFCDSFGNPRPIPDDDPAGLSDQIMISDPRLIADLDISLDIDHTWVGDLSISLTHQETGRVLSLIDRPGIPASDQGCANDNIRTILDDEISLGVENKCSSGPAAISGIYQPQEPLAGFDGESVTGTWTLQVFDQSHLDSGALRAWCLVASISPVPEPTPPPPPPPSLPDQRILSGITGKDQALPLDCESRSAVDWAKYFGVTIGELDFYNHLPHSDNPDKGFVGNVNGVWGRIPPNAYGVHAQPVAQLLQAYGVQAYAHRPLSWDSLRAEIAAGRPVFVWIVGSLDNGIPVYYTPSDGLHTIVAAYEHTVIITGYTPSRIYYLNGDTIYTTSVTQFLDSWSALGNMAITANPNP